MELIYPIQGDGFDISPQGRLTLTQTAVQNPLYWAVNFVEKDPEVWQNILETF